ncbi:MAG: D-alanyl-D-alanine carboxypeptidase [Alphaproteobacteria bacterium]|nr:D-alanyl-D-alanine carboxypeptidase [Alphaproteobacteria bacterium]
MGFLLAGMAVVATASAPALARQQASIVIDTATNEALRSANADTEIHPASLTKMMTLYLLFDSLSRGELRLETALPVSNRAASREPSRLGLHAGQTILVRDAIPALIIKSANDVASVVAEALSGTETEFAALMTARARLLGMSQTTFRNASGLPDVRQKSTARDLARLGRALFDHFPQYYDHFSAQSFSYGGRTYTTHNNLISDYNGVDGIKTGYVRASGFNVVTSAVKGRRRLIGVVIGGATANARDKQMRDLLDEAFAAADEKERRGTIILSRVPITQLPGARAADKIAISTSIRPSPRPNAAELREVLALATLVDPRPGAPWVPPTPPAGSIFARAAQPATVNDDWGIQVGAFGSPSTAQQYASAIALDLALPDAAQPAIQPIAVNGQDLYRARLFGFSEQEAELSCGRLREQGKSCMLVTPEGDNRNARAVN